MAGAAVNTKSDPMIERDIEQIVCACSGTGAGRGSPHVGRATLYNLCFLC